MIKELPCYIIADLLPLYEDDILSEQTKKTIDKHINECEDCKKIMDTTKTQMCIQTTSIELKTSPFKKIRFYQKTQTVLGAVIAFFWGMCLPIIKLVITILGYGEIPDYYLARLKVAWHIGLLKMFFSGIIVCVIYLLVVLIIKKLVSKHTV